MTILGLDFGGDILKWKRNQAGMELQKEACLPEPEEESGTKFLYFPSDDFACISGESTREPTTGRSADTTHKY